jgi:hypothetical protein
MKMTFKALLLAALCIFALLLTESKATRSISKEEKNESPARQVNEELIALQLFDAYERAGLKPFPAIPLECPVECCSKMAEFCGENSKSKDLRTTGAVQQGIDFVGDAGTSTQLFGVGEDSLDE